MKFRDPDFRNIELILEKKQPLRDTIFEFIISDAYLQRRSGYNGSLAGFRNRLQSMIFGYWHSGYDFCPTHASEFHFTTGAHSSMSTISLNEGSMISSREEYDKYVWNDPEDFTLDHLIESAELLPDKMKYLICAPCGVLENVIAIVGFENLCMMIYDDSALAEEIFYQVGTRLIKNFRRILHYDFVGGIISNDDWGFNTQTMLPPDLMRKYVFPYHMQIVDDAHKAGKYAILHSCGNLEPVMDDIIHGMRFDGKHSFEDNICSIEDSYEKWKGQIALLGGIDMNFLTLSTPEQVKARCQNMLEISRSAGGYALGSGNSIPDSVPYANWVAMLEM